MRLAAAAALLLLAAPALAQDVAITWQARLLDPGGAPLSGPHDVGLTLRDGASAVLWQKTFDDVPVADGYVSLVLSGADQGLPPRTLTADVFVHDVFVGVSVDGAAELSPQQALTSAPRAAAVVGSVRLLGDPSPCDAAHAGTLRWSGDALDVCTGLAWTEVVRAIPDGSGQATAAASCKAIHDAYPLLPDGPYWIDPNGGSTSDAFQAWCEMDYRDGGWTLCLSNIARGKGLTIADSNTWWTTTWDRGARVFTRGNSDQGSSWGNFCPLMADDITEIYATVHAESNALTTGDVCTANPDWWTPDAGHMALSCQGSTLMSALPKSGYQPQNCTGCIYYNDQTSPNTTVASWAHNYYGTHVIARLGGATAYGPSGIHWGYVNPGMADPSNGGDVHCGENNGVWCYEAYWARNNGATPNVWKKSMQLWVR